MNTPTDVASAQVALREYQLRAQAARDRFATCRGMLAMISSETNARTMAAFLLHFSALSIPITEPVEGWIRRAGERCDVLGMPDIGRALKGHAKAEAGHHQYHSNDFAALTQLWNARWAPPADPDAIRSLGLTPGGERYCRVHEENIAGPTPYCQLAIEYEIELLPVEYGARFVDNCVRLFGREILDCMSFVTSHVEFDVGHTKFNAHVLGSLISQKPDALGALVGAGAAALDAFADHLTECLGFAEACARGT